MSKNSYRCVVVSGTNTQEDIQGLLRNGATIEEMKEILSAYGIGKDRVTIHPVHNIVSSYLYEIDDEYRAQLEAMFWGD